MEAAGDVDRGAWWQDSVCRATCAAMVEAVLQSTGAAGNAATKDL